MSPLTDWANFYVIAGSSAGALIGLMFVVISLTTGVRNPTPTWAIGTFNTPTIVHFSAVLFTSLLLSAPWPALSQAAFMLGLTGLVGVTYAAIVVLRMRRRLSYEPVLEDWLWNATFPLIAYTVFVVAAVLLPGNPVPALFAVAGMMVLLLFVGIHNAWDVVTFLVTERLVPQDDGASKE